MDERTATDSSTLSLLTLDTYLCCGSGWRLDAWLDHVERSHEPSEMILCVVCAFSFSLTDLRAHLLSEHLFACPYSPCRFVSPLFEELERHTYTHQQNTSTFTDQAEEEDGETSRRISSLLRTQRDIRSVCMAKHLVLHSIEGEDRGFGCGFRNLQTLLESILYNDDLKTASSLRQTPTIEQLQEQIEMAWRSGFDPEGAAQLRHRLIGTRKWIGATEVAAFLQYRRIRVQLVDVKLLMNRVQKQRQLIDWVWHYFNSGGPRIPLYFQHQGHSRTIIGIVENTTMAGKELLIYDPASSPLRIRDALNRSSAKDLNFLRFPPSTLTHPEYQIVAVCGVLQDDFYETAKDFTSFNHLTL
ncbi:Zinc finger with UFM1-specific peptidase domain protein [Toxocara canis]|uniref:Zinc finger with UFM1-specific peptidase domain protein n=1 Tax=Toxocara canis TaxID=6265 RepID=A0A0B2UWF7_TOXCA|nr:Zinc finger with UFM1-specific peptidase domain protein [Toxocara canis]